MDVTTPNRFKLVIPLGIVVVDQLIKVIARAAGVFVLNDRWLGLPVHSWYFSIGLLCLIVSILILWVRSGHSVSFGLILVGGVSNMIDRFVHGGVIDYIFLKSFVFNISDIVIWLGCAMCLLQQYYVSSHKRTF